MTCIFNWFLPARPAGNVSPSRLNEPAIGPSVMPEGADIPVDNVNRQASWARGGQKKPQNPTKSARSTRSSLTSVRSDSPALVMSLTHIGAELFVVCLGACYSKGEVLLRTTLDFISTTPYSNSCKLLFVARTTLPMLSRFPVSSAQTKSVSCVISLCPVRKTLVGDAGVRGVSGGERKPIEFIAEAMACRTLVNCWDKCVTLSTYPNGPDPPLVCSST